MINHESGLYPPGASFDSAAPFNREYEHETKQAYIVLTMSIPVSVDCVDGELPCVDNALSQNPSIQQTIDNLKDWTIDELELIED